MLLMGTDAAHAAENGAMHASNTTHAHSFGYFPLGRFMECPPPYPNWLPETPSNSLECGYFSDRYSLPSR